MYISRQNARSIVDEMKTAIHRDINIMDENGVILASTNPVRQGQVHQGALRIIRRRGSSRASTCRSPSAAGWRA